MLHAEGAQDLDVGAVADLGGGDVGQHVLKGLAVLVGDHYLALVLAQCAAEVVAEGAHADYEEGFHGV